MPGPVCVRSSFWSCLSILFSTCRVCAVRRSSELSCNLSFRDRAHVGCRPFPARRRNGLAGDALPLANSAQLSFRAIRAHRHLRAARHQARQSAGGAARPGAARLLRLQRDDSSQRTGAVDRGPRGSSGSTHRRNQLRDRAAGRVARRYEQRCIRLRAERSAGPSRMAGGRGACGRHRRRGWCTGRGVQPGRSWRARHSSGESNAPHVPKA